MAKTKKNTAEAAVTAAVPSGYVPTLKKVYKDEIVPKLMKEFSYTTVMQVPKLVKITINQGIGDATGDKKLVETAQQELTAIAGQKAIATHSRKDISNFKLRKGMPIGVKVTLRATKMYEFLERLIRISLPRIRDFNGISENFSASSACLSRNTITKGEQDGKRINESPRAQTRETGCQIRRKEKGSERSRRLGCA